MKLYSNSFHNGESSHYVWAESLAQCLEFERENQMLGDGEELTGLDGIYEVKLKPGILGFIDWTEPEEPFESELIYNPKASRVDGNDRSNRSDSK